MPEQTVTHVSSQQERERRYAGLREIMDQNGLAAMVVCARGDEFVRGRIQYVSDIFQWGGRGFVVLPRNGDAVFIVDPLWGLGYASQSGWVTDLRMPESAGLEIGKVLSDAGLASSEIGVVGFDILSVHDYKEMKRGLPEATLNDATDLFDDFRAIKSQEEIDNLYETSAILRTVFDGLKAEIRPGVQQRVVMAHAHRLARQYGCMFGIALMGAAPFRAFFPESDRVIQKGDIMVIDLEWGGPSNYWVELRRCYSFGPPPDEIRRFWDTRVESFATCVEAMKDGNSSNEILAARDRVYAKYGQTAEGLINYTAHGIGVDSLEPPWVPGKERIMRENMVINLHPNIRVADAEQGLSMGGVSLADNVVVGRDGGIRMTDQVDEWVVLDA
jgi:Xaa-Pro aminopeptidase